MTKSLRFFAFTLAFLGCYTCLAQHTRIPKLEIAKGDTYIVGPDNTLYVDTLIMHDKATLRFAPALHGVLDVKAAYIGKKCTITSKGADGKAGKGINPGQDGENGGNLTIFTHYEELGTLTIDTRGGYGGNGAHGQNGKQGIPDRHEMRTMLDAATGKTVATTVLIPGTPGTDGTDATMGGNGGNGGNIMLLYSTNNFIPIFNNERAQKHSITIFHTKGSRGISGTPGRGGFQKLDGIVVQSEVKPNIDGQLMLVNNSHQ